MAETATRRRRAGGRSGNQRLAGRLAIDQSPWHPPENTDPPVEPLDADGVAAIHDGAMRILEEIGIEFLNAEARAILRQAGCRVADTNIRMGRDFVMEMVGRAPSQFTITPRNPDRQITVGGRNMVFVNVSSPPNYWDMETGKVPGTRAHCADLLKLTQYFNCIHVAGGYPVEPVDIHASVRHLDVLFDKLTLTDKVAHAYSLGRERVEDVFEMVRIAGGLTHEAFEATPRMYTNINSTSPLKHDEPMLDGAMRLRGATSHRGHAVHAGRRDGAGHDGRRGGAVEPGRGAGVIALLQYIAPGVPWRSARSPRMST
jgi:trimethylamine--corrinoid protein Co-methyltransferase